MRLSNPAGAWMLSIRTGTEPALRKPCSTPGGASTNVPGGAGTTRSPNSNPAGRDLDDLAVEPRRVDGPREELDVAQPLALAGRDDDRLAHGARTYPLGTQIEHVWPNPSGAASGSSTNDAAPALRCTW
jgi:hypothetical protein